jgi:hypothetical protein
MTADWVAVTVRGRGLAGRRIGVAGARRLARLPSLAAAVDALSRTAYRRDVRSGMDVRAAQHAVYATLTWHLRILAGWAPPYGADRVRRLASAFEIANVAAQVARFDGRPAEPPYQLGALSTGGAQIGAARSPLELQAALKLSPWGDPGSVDGAAIVTAMQAVWARRVAESIPESEAWASAFAVLLVARSLANGGRFGNPAARRNVRAIIGPGWERAASLDELRANVPRATAWILDGVATATDLWRAQTRWWARIEADGLRLCASPRPEPEVLAGIVALLAADAWRTRGALELAARGGTEAAEWFDAVA